MRKVPFWFRDLLTTAVILGLCFCASLLMQHHFNIPEHITTSFAFAVFLISLLTEGYGFGLAAALISVLLVNYAFTFPYFALNFIIPSNFYSAVVMTVISVMTSALTTKIKQQEAMKAESEKERMRANLLRAVSHDLRTPLTTIYGSTTVLLENMDSLSQEKRNRMLLGIREDAQWLIRMVENLLSVTRIGSGSVKLVMTPTALDELVDSVIVKFHKSYPSQAVILDIPDELVMIPMDAMLIEQVLINLLENAVHHATGMTKLCFTVTLKDKQAIFEVRDNGCGIAAERLPHIFSALYDSQLRPADGQKGNAGIGLSVCSTIIRAHGNKISAYNDQNGGAVFRFALMTEDTNSE